MKQNPNQWATKKNPNQAAKMRSLSMSKMKHVQGAITGDEGSGDEATGEGADGFAQFASKKKRSGCASVNNDGFAQIMNKKKHNRGTYVGDKEGLKISMIIIEKDGYTNSARMRRFRNLADIIPTHHVQDQCGPNILAQSGQHIPTQSGKHVPNQLGPIPNQSGQCVSNHLKQHSPAQSKQHASKSGQSTPDQSRQLSAQSHQRTPETQSHQHTSAAQSELREHTPAPSYPSTLNVLSAAANDNVSWDIGFTQSDGRTRVEVINKVLEPSHECSSKIRQIMYERLEPTGYNWKSVLKKTQSFYFEEFKKYFVWRQSDAIIHKGWIAYARKKYSEVFCVARADWENHEQPYNRIGKDVYLSWIEFWKTTEFKKKSVIQKSNHCSGVDGRPSTHTSGSASHRTVAAHLKIKLKRDPTADLLFRVTHMRHLKKKESDWIT